MSTATGAAFFRAAGPGPGARRFFPAAPVPAASTEGARPGGFHGGAMRAGGHHGGGRGGFHGGPGGGGHRGGGGGGRRRSDLRLKHDIVLAGVLSDGLGYYEFVYNGGHTAYVGVMAQEVRFSCG